jgi:hypothetical protein
LPKENAAYFHQNARLPDFSTTSMLAWRLDIGQRLHRLRRGGESATIFFEIPWWVFPQPRRETE